jgi:hypothetical protein
MERVEFHYYPWPWELRAYLWPDEPWLLRDGEGRLFRKESVSSVRIFLLRADAIAWGLWPASETENARGVTETTPNVTETVPSVTETVPTQAGDDMARASARVQNDGQTVNHHP